MTTTSAAGKWTNRGSTPRLRVASSRGFTLLELLVVIAIIGIFIGVVTLSTDLVSFERKMKQEAERLQSLLRLASEDAVLQSNDYGLQLYADSYAFFVFDHDTQEWEPLANDRVFAARTLDQMELDLWIDDRQVRLDLASEAQAKAAAEEAESSAASDAEDNEDDEDDEDETRSPVPQVVIFSSGEFTPFELKVLRASDPFYPGIVLDVEFDGSTELRNDEP